MGTMAHDRIKIKNGMQSFKVDYKKGSTRKISIIRRILINSRICNISLNIKSECRIK
jgi:hypothetical protein